VLADNRFPQFRLRSFGRKKAPDRPIFAIVTYPLI